MVLFAELLVKNIPINFIFIWLHVGLIMQFCKSVLYIVPNIPLSYILRTLIVYSFFFLHLNVSSCICELFKSKCLLG